MNCVMMIQSSRWRARLTATWAVWVGEWVLLGAPGRTAAGVMWDNLKLGKGAGIAWCFRGVLS